MFEKVRHRHRCRMRRALMRRAAEHPPPRRPFAMPREPDEVIDAVVERVADALTTLPTPPGAGWVTDQIEVLAGIGGLAPLAAGGRA